MEARDAAEWQGVHPGFESPRGVCDFPVASVTHLCILGGARQHICSHSQKAETEVLATLLQREPPLQEQSLASSIWRLAANLHPPGLGAPSLSALPLSSQTQPPSVIFPVLSVLSGHTWYVERPPG